MNSAETHVPCDCGSAKTFDDCCGPLLRGEREAESAEALMRSRYSAYRHRDMDYLRKSTDPQRQLEVDWAATRAWMEDSRFTGLKVLNHVSSGNKATVEFEATFRPRSAKAENGVEAPAQIHRETARFRLQGGRWFFRPR